MLNKIINFNKIPDHPERISNLIPFIPNYNWGEINFPAGPKEYSDFEKKYYYYCIKYIFYILHKEFGIRPCYISKFNKTREHQAHLLIITEGKDIWHYIAIKSMHTCVITRCIIYSQW